MFTEADLVPISALQHLLFCERQAALIHVERLWVENRLTIEGRGLHARAHGDSAGPRGGGISETRGGVTISRAVQLRSLQWGIFGVADVVEFRTAPSGNDRPADHSPPGTPYPIEYKRGRPKSHDADRVQVCAQALCLEEMLGVSVPLGALFYGKTRRREELEIGPRLRSATADAIARMHRLIGEGRTPTARREKKCDRCSLLNLCLPQVTGTRRSAAEFTRQALLNVLADPATGEGEPP